MPLKIAQIICVRSTRLSEYPYQRLPFFYKTLLPRVIFILITIAMLIEHESLVE